MRNIPGLTMRATVERDVGTTINPYGAKSQSADTPRMREIHTDSDPLRCEVQPVMQRIATSDGKYLTVTAHRIIAPARSDLQEGDVVTEVRRKNGEVLYSGRRRLVGVLFERDHTKGTLENYG